MRIIGYLPKTSYEHTSSIMALKPVTCHIIAVMCISSVSGAQLSWAPGD